MSVEVLQSPPEEIQDAALQDLGRMEAELVKSVHIPDKDVRKVIVGSAALEGAILFEGSVGTGKTYIAKAMATIIGGRYGRVQGTPDVMPSDITGTRIWDASTHKWEFVPGPVFANNLLVDEINRMPTRTQSAMLQAMQEREVTISGETDSRKLNRPFIVFGTQNPDEEAQGTNPLTVAQIDRFNVSVQQQALRESDYAAIDTVKKHKTEQKVELHRLPFIKAGVESLAVSPEAATRAQRLLPALRSVDAIDTTVSMLDGYRGYDETVRYAKIFALFGKTELVGEEHIDMAAQFTLPHRLGFTYDAMYDQNVTKSGVIKDTLNTL